MSIFEIKEKFSRTIPQVTVKRIDEKWKNFPGSTLPPEYVEKLENFKDFSVRHDDVFILGFPRSGTTRLQELVWIIANDFDFETLIEYDCDARIAFFETPEWSFQFRKKPMAKSFQDMKSPRTMKCHLPVQLLPDEIWTKKPKLLHISRDPKDVAVSDYHLMKNFSSVPIKIEDFLEDFLDDAVMYSPYREYVWNYLNLPGYENILYLTYEKMSADLEGTIQMVADFLGKELTKENMEKIKEYLKFDNMKARKTNDNKETIKMMTQSNDASKKFEFIRKGVIGGYREDMSKEYADRINNWYAESGSLNQGYNYKDYDAIKKVFGS